MQLSRNNHDDEDASFGGDERHREHRAPIGRFKFIALFNSGKTMKRISLNLCATALGFFYLSTQHPLRASEIAILDEPGGVGSANWEVGDANPRGDAYPFGLFSYWGSFGGGTIVATTPSGKSYCAAVNYYG